MTPDAADAKGSEPNRDMRKETEAGRSVPMIVCPRGLLDRDGLVHGAQHKRPKSVQ